MTRKQLLLIAPFAATLMRGAETAVSWRSGVAGFGGFMLLYMSTKSIETSKRKYGLWIEDRTS